MHKSMKPRAPKCECLCGNTKGLLFILLLYDSVTGPVKLLTRLIWEIRHCRFSLSEHVFVQDGVCACV